MNTLKNSIKILVLVMTGFVFGCIFKVVPAMSKETPPLQKGFVKLEATYEGEAENCKIFKVNNLKKGSSSYLYFSKCGTLPSEPGPILYVSAE